MTEFISENLNQLALFFIPLLVLLFKQTLQISKVEAIGAICVILSFYQPFLKEFQGEMILVSIGLLYVLRFKKENSDNKEILTNSLLQIVLVGNLIQQQSIFQIELIWYQLLILISLLIIRMNLFRLLEFGYVIYLIETESFLTYNFIALALFHIIRNFLEKNKNFNEVKATLALLILVLFVKDNSEITIVSGFIYLLLIGELMKNLLLLRYKKPQWSINL